MPDALFDYWVDTLMLFHRSPKAFYTCTLIALFMIVADELIRRRNGPR